MAGETELVMTAEVARRLSGLGGLYDIDYHARAIRHWVQIGLLEPVSYRGQGRTAAALFDEPQILLARLLFAMTATGISPQQMAAAKRLFRNVHPSPRGTWSGLATVVKRLRAGERWHFVIHLMIDEDLGLAGGFEEIPDLGNPLIEGQKLVSLVFDCRALFRDLLALDDADPKGMPPQELEAWADDGDE